jgi:vitamin B12 transporter
VLFRRRKKHLALLHYHCPIPDGKVSQVGHKSEDLPMTTTSTSFREKSQDENCLLQEAFHCYYFPGAHSYQINKTMSKKFLFFSFLLSGITAFAQQDKITSLDEVVITSNKYPKKQTETGKVLTVITREQLDKSGGKTLNEILNNVAGTTVIGSQSNPGTNQTVSIRGSTAGNVLILIDGIPVNDPSVITNYFDMNFFSVDQIERVEVLKGGQSTLYGSDAVAGVINIITRKSKEPGIHAGLGLSAGSYGTVRTNIGLRQQSEKSLLSVQYGYTTSKGFSSAHDSVGTGNFDKDSYRQHNITGTWQVSLTNKLKANIFGFYSRYKTGIDAGAFKDEKDYTVTTDNFQGGAGLTYQVKDGAVKFNYRYNDVKRNYLDDSVFNAPNYLKSDYEGRTHFMELYGNKKWKHIEILAGIDYRQNNMSNESVSVSAYGTYKSSLSDTLAKMSQVSPYASVVLKANKVFNIEIGGRWNSHSVYGNNFTYTINPSAFINNKIKIFSNVYSAFKTPTLYQLFDPFSGNRALIPEKSFNAEAGAQWFITNEFNVRGVYFHRDTKDAIEYTYTDPVNYIAQYTNIDKKKAGGLEFEAVYTGKKWNASANYTYTRATLHSSLDNTGLPLGKDTTVNYLFRNPSNVVNISAGLQVVSRFYAGLETHIAGKRLEPVYAGSPLKLGSYYTVDLYLEYTICKKCKIYTAFRNITDQQYFELRGYNARRFNFTGGLQLSL